MDGTALILSGGGAKGAYQIGVWKALVECNLKDSITAVSGTSIGALNGALFLNGDYNRAEKLWLSLTSEKVLRPDFTKFFRCIFSLSSNSFLKRKLVVTGLLCLCDFGLFSMDVVENIIDKNLNLYQISKSKIDFYVTCTEVPLIKAVYFKLNKQPTSDIREKLMASAAIPLIFDDVDINEKHYYDGGIVDNTPIKPLYDLGYRNFIVVPLAHKSIINKKKFPDCKFTEIISSKKQGGLIKGTLNFSPDISLRNIELGYTDAMKILKPVKN
ncbi:MAG: putative patatin-like phospholipase [Clostridiales bacterium]|jgi:NTE family protein|nr:putative patatin-like phospholipase [Clostridiales bacterium]